MLSTVRTAVESTIGTRPAAGAVCSVRPFLDFGRFLVAMMNSLGASLHLQLDPPYRSRSSIGATIARCVSKMLKAISERAWSLFNGLRIRNAARGASLHDVKTLTRA